VFNGILGIVVSMGLLFVLLLIGSNSIADETPVSTPPVIVGDVSFRGRPATRQVKHDRPFDASDPAMQAYAEYLFRGGGRDCAYNGRFYRYGYGDDVRAQFVAGGDRLARYFIEQYEASLREGYVDAIRFLKYVAYTGSETAFAYLSELIRRGPSQLGSNEYRYALAALAKMLDPRSIDMFLHIVASEEESGIRRIAVSGIGSILDRTEVDRPDAVNALRTIEAAASEAEVVRRSAWGALNKLERYGLIPRREVPADLGPPRKISERILEISRQLGQRWLEAHPEAAGSGCAKQFIHCGLVD
jgi:hypothetical protein